MRPRNIIMGLTLVFVATGVAEAHVSLGDMHCDGTLDSLDIPLFVDCVLNGNRHCPVVIDTVTAGNPGNPGDTRYPYPPVLSFGGAYTYNIGKYEVTAGQYTEFLRRLDRVRLPPAGIVRD